ncbi:MAG: pyrroline-5-carboxylate reductase [Lentisphaeria bacterium]|nr:pyrroline-5-carboxylate reductase [Lentisphaeria bacterium]
MSKLFFIGTGKMATAIAGGIVKSQMLSAGDIAGFDINPAAAESFTQATGVAAYTSGLETHLAEAETVLLAVKPQMLASALASCRTMLADKAVLSIAAGVTIAQLEELTSSARIVRIMPNTPALVGCGAAGFSAAAGALKEDIDFAGKIFSSIGIALQLREEELDAVTALSGSGPAYVFEFIQALADGGVAEGLPRDTALKLAAQTVFGAAKMVMESNVHPQQLKDNVTSPGGTTSRALELMAERGFSGIVMQSVRAAARRSRELGGKK